MELAMEHETEYGPRHPLQEAFDLRDEEFERLTACPAEGIDERDMLLAELSVNLVGHLTREEIGEFLRTPQPTGIAADERHLRERIPLDVAPEPDGLRRIVEMARREVGRRIADATPSRGVPQNT